MDPDHSCPARCKGITGHVSRNTFLKFPEACFDEFYTSILVFYDNLCSRLFTTKPLPRISVWNHTDHFMVALQTNASNSRSWLPIKQPPNRQLSVRPGHHHTSLSAIAALSGFDAACLSSMMPPMRSPANRAVVFYLLVQGGEVSALNRRPRLRGFGHIGTMD